jgi:hypothetical protein
MSLLAFPMMNRIGRKIRPILISRAWLPTVLLLCALLYLPSL